MPSNNPRPVLAYPTIAKQREHVHTTNPACHCGNIELAIAKNPENIQYIRKYPRRAIRPAHLPVGRSIFREEMDAPITNPVAHVRNDSAVAIRQPQREAPMLMREGAARGMQEEMSKTDRSCMAPVTAAMAPVTSAVSTLFSRAHEAFHRATPQSSSEVLTPRQCPAQPEQIPVELEELYIPNHPSHYHRYVRSSPPQAPPLVAQLHRSNAIRRPHPPMPVGRRPARAHAVRRPTRNGILFPGATECVLSHHPGGLADSYCLPDALRQQHTLPPVNGWEEQRLVGGETLLVPFPTRRAVDKPLPPLPTNEPRQPLRSSHGPPRRPLPSHGTNQLPSLSTMPGLQDPVQRSDYLLWRNMNTNATTSASTNDSLSSGYVTYTTTHPDNVSDGILEAAPAGDRFSISDDDDAFSVGSSLHDDSDEEDANVPATVPAQGRFVLSDSEEDGEGGAVGMALRVVNCGTREQVERIVRDQRGPSDESSTEGSTLSLSDASPDEVSTVSFSQSSSADADEFSSDDDAPGGSEPAERRSPHESSEDSWDTDDYDDFLNDTEQALTLHRQRREPQQTVRNQRAAENVPVIRPASPSEESSSASDSGPETLQGTPSASDSSDTLIDDEDDEVAIDLENWDLYAPPTASVEAVPGTPRPDSPVLPAPSQSSATSSFVVNASPSHSIPLPSPPILPSPPMYWDWPTAPTPATPPRSLSLAEPWLAPPTTLLLLDLQYENIRYPTFEEDGMAEFHRLADAEECEEENWWNERSETMLSDTAFEEQVNDPTIFADFDGSWDDDLPPAYDVDELLIEQPAAVEDLPPAYEDLVIEPNYSSFDPLIAYSSTSMLQPIPRRLRARGHQTRARNPDWESYIEHDSQADEERVADEVELPSRPFTCWFRACERRC